MSARTIAAVAAGVCCWVGSASAQSWRPYSTFRQLHGETRLDAQLEFAAGMLKVTPGRQAELYRMQLSYDAERYVPLSQYEGSASTVRLGVESAGYAGLRVVSRNQLRQKALVELSPRTDLALDLNLGAGEADVDLGGLRINRVRVETGASRATVPSARSIHVAGRAPIQKTSSSSGASASNSRGRRSGVSRSGNAESSNSRLRANLSM